MDMRTLLGKLIVLISFVGVASALECLVCDWDIHNSTVEDNCVGAPFKTNTTTCEEGSPSKRIVCQTHSKFNKESKSLERLERKCGTKHSRCNNACPEEEHDCWLCCENDKCNGFPLRVNIVLISSAAERSTYFSKFVVLTITWLSLSFQ